jgi:hypothetical protein
MNSTISPLISTTRPSASRPPPLLFFGAVLVWVGLTVTLGVSGVLQGGTALIPVLLVCSVAGPILTWRRSQALQAWGAHLDLRLLVGWHLVRIGFGALFLVEMGRGALPAFFAERGGWGDILAGGLVLPVLAVLTWGSARVGRRVTLAWNVFGLADILLVVATAQYGFFVLQDPLLVAAISRPPYVFLPTLVVPLVILTHLLVFSRTLRRPEGAPGVTAVARPLD